MSKAKSPRLISPINGEIYAERSYVDSGLCWTGCKDTGRCGAMSVVGYPNLTRPKSYH